MSYRNTRGRYGTRASNSDNYSPAYSTQAGYQNNQGGQTTNASQPQNFNQNFKQSGQASAIKQEYESPAKKEESQEAAVKTSSPQPPATTDASMMDDGDDKSEKPWKKKIFQKLPKKVKKKRLNAKLRNLLAPKNAMMVLHELHPGLSCTTNEETTNNGQASYTVTIDIDGKQFKGQGLSKVQAKQTACENALKSALIEKMAQSTVQKTPAEPVQAMDTNEAEGDSTGTNGDTSGEGKARKPPEEDDVPWGSLASYALFKLFSEWQAQGYSLPTSPGKHQVLGVQIPPQPSPNTMMPMKKMPPDAAQRHPVQLLNQLKPHAQYLESREGNPPSIVFTFTVTFEGQTFTGAGPNKKDAKKACAKNALVSLGIQYTE